MCERAPQRYLLLTYRHIVIGCVINHHIYMHSGPWQQQVASALPGLACGQRMHQNQERNHVLSIAVSVMVLSQGKFEELQPARRLVFSWRFNNWEDGCFSKVTQKIPVVG